MRSTDRRLGTVVLLLLVIGLADSGLWARRSATEEGWQNLAGTIQTVDAKSVDVNVTALVQQ